jgi:hypothetical protein
MKLRLITVLLAVLAILVLLVPVLIKTAAIACRILSASTFISAHSF